jgi:repressor LexA
MSKGSARRYHRLVIRASPRTDIWLADDGGHLVQKELGTLDTSLVPGRYVVEFGLDRQTYPIHLVQDSEYSQAEIEDGPSCPRPEIKLAPLYTAKQGQYRAFIYYYTKIHGEPPSEAEMRRYFRVTPPSVHHMVLALEAKGLIARTSGEARSIKLLVDRAELPDLT